MTNLFGFDLDDTLILTHFHYVEALDGVLGVVERAFVDNLTDEFLEKYKRINREMENTAGFYRHVFRDSLLEAFGELARENGLSGSVLDDSIYSIGHYSEIPFDTSRLLRAGTVDGALDTLEFLANKGNDLAIVTLGDDAFQRRKIELLGISDYVPDDMIFTDLHGKRHILEELSSRGYDKRIFTGNSWKSDMVPAWNAGYARIYIQGGKGRERDGLPGERDGGFIRLNSVSEIKENYDSVIGMN